MLGALEQSPDTPVREPAWTLADSWIWARLQELVRSVDRLFTAYQYGEAGRQILDFIWGEFADWYIEIAKLQLAEGGDRAFWTGYTLVRILDMGLRMLHPFTPFVTEELWGYLKQACLSRSVAFTPKQGWEEALIVAQFPKVRELEGWEEQKVAEFNLVQEIIRGIRNLRAEKKVQPSKRIPAVLACGDHLAVLKTNAAVIAHLGMIDTEAFTLVHVLEEKPSPAVSFVVAGVELYLPLAGLVDSSEERARLEKELAETQGQITRLDGLLSGSFAEKAPPAVVEKERQKLATYRDSAVRLQAQLDALG